MHYQAGQYDQLRKLLTRPDPKRVLEPAVPAGKAKKMRTSGDGRATLRGLSNNGEPILNVNGGDRRLQVPVTRDMVGIPFSDRV